MLPVASDNDPNYTIENYILNQIIQVHFVEGMLGGGGGGGEGVFMSPVLISNLFMSQFQKVHMSLSEFQIRP